MLRRTILLIDARHGIKDSDLKVMGLLDTAGVSYRSRFPTKTDKIAAAKLVNVLAETPETLAGAYRRPSEYPADQLEIRCRNPRVAGRFGGTGGIDQTAVSSPATRQNKLKTYKWRVIKQINRRLYCQGENPVRGPALHAPLRRRDVRH